MGLVNIELHAQLLVSHKFESKECKIIHRAESSQHSTEIVI